MLNNNKLKLNDLHFLLARNIQNKIIKNQNKIINKNNYEDFNLSYQQVSNIN